MCAIKKIGSRKGKVLTGWLFREGDQGRPIWKVTLGLRTGQDKKKLAFSCVDTKSLESEIRLTCLRNKKKEVYDWLWLSKREIDSRRIWSGSLEPNHVGHCKVQDKNAGERKIWEVLSLGDWPRHSILSGRHTVVKNDQTRGSGDQETSCPRVIRSMHK